MEKELLIEQLRCTYYNGEITKKQYEEILKILYKGE